MIFTPFGDLEWGDERGLWQWLIAHDIKHQALSQALERLGATLPAFLLSAGIDDAWVQTHYQQHLTLLQSVVQDQNTSVYDLLTNPLSDEETFYDWQDIHNQLHQQLDQAFGIVSN